MLFARDASEISAESLLSAPVPASACTVHRVGFQNSCEAPELSAISLFRVPLAAFVQCAHAGIALPYMYLQDIQKYNPTQRQQNKYTARSDNHYTR